MKLSHVLVAVALLGLVCFSVADAKEKGKGGRKGPKGVAGKVVSVDTEAKTLTLKKKGGEVTVTTDGNTEIIVNGAAGSLADIKPGMVAMATPATGTATKVIAKTPGEKRKDGEGKGKGKRKGKKDKGGDAAE